MRPVSNDDSALQTPLNNILGYQANVRLLRSLVRAGHAMSHSELADRTGVSLPGVHKVVSRLLDTGIIEYSGSGKQQQIILRHNHPMAEALCELFRSEEAYYDSLLDALKGEIKTLEVKPDSAWIFEKVARGEDDYGDPVRLALLGGLKSIDTITDNFRNCIYDKQVEKRFDVTIDVIGVTLADLEARPNLYHDGIILLWGPDPESYLAEKGSSEEGDKKTHLDLDIQSRAEAKAWTGLLNRYPEIIDRAIRSLKDRVTNTTGGEKKELQEWKHILESMSYQRLKKFLESDTDRATRLRQSLPFWEVLNKQERREFEKLKMEESLK